MNRIAYVQGTYKYQLAEDYTVRVPILPPEDVITDWYALTASGVLLTNVATPTGVVRAAMQRWGSLSYVEEG